MPPSWEKHFSILDRLRGKGAAKPDPEASGSSSGASAVELAHTSAETKPAVLEAAPAALLSTKREQAIHGLLLHYQSLKQQAVELSQNTSTIDQALKQLQSAEAVLKEAEHLRNLKPDQLSQSEKLLDSIIADYPAPSTPEPRTPASTPDTLSATTPEGREITLDLKKELTYWTKFYTEHHIDWVLLPTEIKLTPDQITKMQELMTQGFDKLLIIPANLVPEPTLTTDPATGKPTAITNPRYTQLHTLLSQGYNTTFQGDAYKQDGGLQGSQDQSAHLRLILTKDVQNLEDDPLFKSTLGKSMDQLTADELTKYTGLSEASYLIYQREYFERTGKHLDEEKATWLPESPRPLSCRVAVARWSPGHGQLRFNSNARDYHGGNLGCRLAGSFELEI